MTQIVPISPQKAKAKKAFMQVLQKAGSVNNMFVPTSANQQKGIWNYGKDNLLPNKLLGWVLESGTAKLAQAKRATYITADGFIDPDLSKRKVNKNQTADDLLAEISGYVSYFKGLALRVKRNGNSEIVDVQCLPFQTIRKKLDGSFSYNPSLSEAKFDKSKDTTIPAFKGARVLTVDELLEVRECGELLYCYQKTADNPIYPIPQYYAGIEDVRTSSELQKFDYETVMNGFITSGILTIIGGMDDENKDEAGKSERDYFLEELEGFTGGLKDANGVSGRNRLLVITANSKDEAPTLSTFDSKAIFEASTSKRDTVDRAVSRLFEVNPVLIGFADAAVLGNQQALANASDELGRNVMGDQRLISNAFLQLWPDLDWTISTFKPIQYIPPEVWSKLTDNEIRQLGGFAELPQSAGANDKLLSEKLGVGGTQSLTTIITDPVLTQAQKVNLLKLLFGISETDANLLVYGTETKPTEGATA